MFTFPRLCRPVTIAACNFSKRLLGIRMSSPASKKLATMVKIGTHSGCFHCDEVLAVYLLQRLPQYKHAEIIRTRDEKILKTCDIVVDVGGEYDPGTHRYDHHQRSFNESMNSILKTKPWTIKLSSAGLVFCHFGMDVLKEMLPELANDEKALDALYDQIYSKFVMEIDAIDNGIPMFDGEPKYNIHSHLSARVSHFNPPWNEPPVEDGCLTHFSQAMEMVGKEFQDRVNYYGRSWWSARALVLEAMQNRFKIHESGGVIELETMCPWKEHMFELFKELDVKNGDLKFVIFGSSGSWRVQAIPIASNSFVCHRFLLKPWRGLRDDEVSKVSGIDNCIFVHANGFIGGNKTREGALQMAVKSIEAGKQPDDGEP